MAMVDVLCPWPGRVAEVHVQPGAGVTVGQDLVTIESMKILTPVASEHDGRVAAVHVELNSFVQERSRLLSIETA